jgi:superfamily II DNA or RNA helicase
MKPRPEGLFTDEVMHALRAQGRERAREVPGPGARPPVSAPSAEGPRNAHDWISLVEGHLSRGESQALEVAERAVDAHPTDGMLLLLASFAAVSQAKPEVALRYLKRSNKWYAPIPPVWACEAIALAQLGRWPLAHNLVEKYSLHRLPAWSLTPPSIPQRWGPEWMRRIRQWQPQTEEKPARPAARRKSAEPRPAPLGPPSPAAGAAPPLPAAKAEVSLTFVMPDTEQYAVVVRSRHDGLDDLLLRYDFTRLSLLRGFDELLCLPHLHGVDHYWFQVETVRKVLKQFRGRVLLADEVGLGKTVEAGLALKEYLLRGMVERVLILVPASLVGQWHEEMTTKFGIEFATTHDALLHRDPPAFWSQPRIIASIAAARLSRHFELVTRTPADLVIVDEAQHLKNRSSRNWQLVDALQKRFLLLLSATPVENSLVELYNLLTLLKPGMFKTEKEFRLSYVQTGHPRLPVNRDRLRDLMRDVMIRNTRALVDVRLPPRHALTIRIDPAPDESGCYQELSRLIRQMRQEEHAHHRLALHHLLQAAGSSPAAVTAALDRFVKNDLSTEWQGLRERYAAVPTTAKIEALLEIMDRNPTEKKMVFVHFRETLEMLDRLLSARHTAFARFDGHLTGPQKDRAIEQFRTEATVLLCTESGGEGRNVQFCNTLINFDLHWNPQAIEQRIGRLHRIGQQRDVFVFNLAVRGTIEDRILTILDEKINMFELVVGEIQSILGEMEEGEDFAELVLSAWLQTTDAHREQAFDELSGRLLKARAEYEQVKAYDDELFGEEFEVV